MIEPQPIPSFFDKFVAALTTLYRRFSVQLDLAGTAFLTWLLSRTPAELDAFLAHLWIPAWLIPPLIFVGRSLLVATPQPQVIHDTAIKAEAKAEAKADALVAEKNTADRVRDHLDKP